MQAPPAVASLDSALGNALGTGPRTLVTGGPGSVRAADDQPWQRKTKVVCTIGPATCSREALFALADAGMNVARCVSAPLRAAAANAPRAPAAVGHAAPAALPPGPGGSTMPASAAHWPCTLAGGVNAPRLRARFAPAARRVCNCSSRCRQHCAPCVGQPQRQRSALRPRFADAARAAAG
jgi:hypothetical protein